MMVTWMLLALLAANPARAAELPAAWARTPPVSSENYHYFVGHAEAAPTSTEAVFQASLRALAELAATLFHAGQGVPPLPGDVRFSGAEEIQVQKIRHLENDTFEAYVLYRYSKEAFQAEQKRRSSPPPAPPEQLGRLRLEVDRSDGLVIVEGLPLAVTVANEPLELEVPANQYINVEVTQFETVRAIRKYYISPSPPAPAPKADEDTDRPLQPTEEVRSVLLQERPGYATVSGQPDGTAVDADDGTTVTLPSKLRFRLNVGKHKFTFHKEGYESREITVQIVRDRIIAIPAVSLATAAEKVARLRRPPWVLEISPVGSHYGTTAAPSVGAFTYGASLDHRLGEKLHLRLGFFHGSGSNQAPNPTDALADPITTDTISSSYLEVGLPIEAYSLSALQTFLLEPEWIFASQSIGGTHVNVSVSQQGAGGEISYRQFFEPGDDSLAVIGVGARLGLTDYYSTSGGLGGKASLSICFVELLIGI